MNFWNTLEQWGNHDKPIVITLIDAEDDGCIGLVAAQKNKDEKPQGPLTEASFWEQDWAIIKGAKTLPGGTVVSCAGRRYYVSPLIQPRSVLILGGGHVGRALMDLMLFLDFQVCLWDDRKDFLKNLPAGVQAVEAPFNTLLKNFPGLNFKAVVIVTRGHTQDSQSLRQVLSAPEIPSYVGMIGSRSRIQSTMEMLVSEGYEEDKLKLVHAPVGLNIGAQTPQEIAVSIAAEIIEVFNRR